MGLDTVELLVAFERFFGISVPDREAEKLARVGDVAAYFTQQLGWNPSPARTEAHSRLLAEIVSCLSDESNHVSSATSFRALWPTPDHRVIRQQIQACVQLTVPDISEPVATRFLSWWQRRLVPSATVPARPPKWAAYTIDDLVDWLLAENYRQLLPAPASLYEVQQAVIGITADKCGIKVSEIQLSDSFTMDLGID